MHRVEASTKTPGTEEREAIGMGLPSQDSSRGGGVVCLQREQVDR